MTFAVRKISCSFYLKYNRVENTKIPVGFDHYRFHLSTTEVTCLSEIS
jgi:hypothetical protein